MSSVQESPAPSATVVIRVQEIARNSVRGIWVVSRHGTMRVCPPGASVAAARYTLIRHHTLGTERTLANTASFSGASEAHQNSSARTCGLSQPEVRMRRNRRCVGACVSGAAAI